MKYGRYWSNDGNRKYYKQNITSLKEGKREDKMSFDTQIEKSDKIDFTSEQKAAILHRGSSLLVSSAAGSGKTKVLVERLLSYIDEGKSIDEFLVITYTRAAARELRERIDDLLQERILNSPGNVRLRRQRLLCQRAYIGTIHTFCSGVLRDNAHLAGLSPDFRVIDGNESDVIKNRVIDTVLERAYEKIEEKPGLRSLLDLIIDGRDDKKLAQIIIDIHSKLRSTPNPEAWIYGQAEKEKSYAAVRDILQTAPGEYVFGKIKAAVKSCKEQMDALRVKMRSYPDFDRAYGPYVDETMMDIMNLSKALEIGWDEAHKNRAVRFRSGRISGYDDLKEKRSYCKKKLVWCATALENSSHDHIKDISEISSSIITLLSLIEEFSRAYEEEKIKRSVLDFSDLEHMALNLLYDQKTGVSKEIGLSLAEKFTEIMIDEYQDVNEVQELIFKSVSKGESNIFMVGDVKQSIYRFRLAVPSIFLEKYSKFNALQQDAASIPKTHREDSGILAHSCREKEGIADTFLPHDNPGEQNEACHSGVKINLSSNFRSHESIIETVNHVFRKIMSMDFGEMEYGDDEALIAGRNSNEPMKGKQGIQGIKGTGERDKRGGVLEDIAAAVPESARIEPDFAKIAQNTAAVELDLISTDTLPESEDEISPKTAQIEAMHVAERIKELVEGGYMIPDKEFGERAIRYSDICILSRSMKNIGWRYAWALSELGIESDMPTGESFFDTIEIAAAVSLLSVIDNPMQDIPLAALLRGPIYSFTSEELAEIKGCNMDKNYYDALMWSQEPDAVTPQTACKCKVVLNDLKSLRLYVYDLPADRFIWHVYRETRLLDVVSAMKNGEKRKNNLLALVEAARDFEENGYRGLFYFLTYLRELQDNGLSITQSSGGKNPGSGSSDAVQIMTIHKSKGLEFPVVFLVNTAKKHNYTDLYKPVVFHKALGLGATMIDPNRRIKYKTLTKTAIEDKMKSELLAEELRVLYVAMTRAREKLIISATFKDAPGRCKKIAGYADNDGGYFADILLSMESVADWIIAGMTDINPLYAGINYVSLSEDVKNEAGFELETGAQEEKAGAKGEVQAEDTAASLETALSDHREKLSLENPSLEKFPVEQSSEICGDSFKYPYEMSVLLPSKLTVTGQRAAAAYEMEPDPEAKGAKWTLSDGDLSKPKSKDYKEYIIKPKFILEHQRFTPAERGTLLHTVMQLIDYKMCADKDNIKKDLARLQEAGFLSEREFDEVNKDLQKIADFFSSDLGKRLIGAKSVSREFRFSLLTEASYYYDNGGSDKILVQGVVDCYFEEANELVVVDFKTDDISDKNITERIKKYTPQLEAYGRALTRITGKPVKERIIYFLQAGKAVPC